jgi:hypothetical protein
MKFLPSRWSGALGATASLFVGLTAATIVPSAIPGLHVAPTLVAQSADCAPGGSAGFGSSAKARPGGATLQDPNELTDAEVDAREADLAGSLQAKGRAKTSVITTVTIPVVFHVISEDGTRANGDIPRRLINNQMDVLNASFSGATGGVDTGFRFTLTQVNRVVNPDWYPIIYGSDTERDMKRALRVGGPETLNIYTGLLSDDLLGWATFPQRDLKPRDGVVMLAESTPGGTATPYNEGDTATHEVGHWLNLYHTFQGKCSVKGDRVVDTPSEKFPQFGCPVGADSCPKREGLDPITNFMDYSVDSCMFAFTQGQAFRMQDAWIAYRA